MESSLEGKNDTHRYNSIQTAKKTFLLSGKENWNSILSTETQTKIFFTWRLSSFSISPRSQTGTESEGVLWVRFLGRTSDCTAVHDLFCCSEPIATSPRCGSRSPLGQSVEEEQGGLSPDTSALQTSGDQAGGTSTPLASCLNWPWAFLALPRVCFSLLAIDNANKQKTRLFYPKQP